MEVEGDPGCWTVVYEVYQYCLEKCPPRGPLSFVRWDGSLVRHLLSRYVNETVILVNIDEVCRHQLQFSDGTLKHGDLRHGIARGFQCFADLIFEVGGVPHAVDQKIPKPFDWE